jgi:hypothetical protein
VARADPILIGVATLTGDQEVPPGAETALLSGIEGGQAYVNIDDATFPGGEIRGDLTVPVPEPSSLKMLALVLIGIVSEISTGDPVAPRRIGRVQSKNAPEGPRGAPGKTEN